MFLTIFCIILCILPTAWALWDDRNGDYHPNRDLWTVAILSAVVSLTAPLINPVTTFWGDLIRHAFLCAAIYISVFPYAVNFMLYHRGIINAKKWWDHLSETAWPDKLDGWKVTPWQARVFVALLILWAGVQVYACPGKIISYYNCCFCGYFS